MKDRIVRPPVNIKAVGVVGAGTMGHGIAQVFAQAGFPVRLVDTEAAALDRARRAIDGSLAKFVSKGTLSTADRDAAIGRLSSSTSLDALARCDYIVEAIVENVDAKRAVLGRLDALCP